MLKLPTVATGLAAAQPLQLEAHGSRSKARRDTRDTQRPPRPHGVGQRATAHVRVHEAQRPAGRQRTRDERYDVLVAAAREHVDLALELREA